MLSTVLVIVVIALIITAIYSMIDSLVQAEAHRNGIDTTKENLGIFPSLNKIFGKAAPTYVDGSKYHILTKGHDVKISGRADDRIVEKHITRFAVKPGDYRGIAPIPKLELEVGGELKAGDPLFYDKMNPEIKFVSPVSGELVELRRGAKRSISHLVVLADKEQQFRKFDVPSLDSDRSVLVDFLKSSGAWTHINQRPYDTIADPSVTPDNIFISCFDTAPLAVSSYHLLDKRGGDVQKGIDVLNKLTDGTVYLGLDAREGHKPHQSLMDAEGVEKHWFNGKHPAGNVGVQIHHIKPIRGNATVWTLKLEDLVVLGKLFNEGIYDTRRIVALTGSQLKENTLVYTYAGASVNELTQENMRDAHTRIVLGNVLSGEKSSSDDFLGAKYNMLTAIKEGDYYELFGWILPLKPRPSLSGTYPNFLFKDFEFEGDTNTHGEKRAFVMTGQYEKVLPMDIYPQHLLKAVMAGDIERMEALGINELSEEDLALAEFSCTSKMPLQSILRDGLEMMREQA